MTALHQAAQKAVARIRHTLMTGLAHNDAIAALNELAALQQQPEPVTKIRDLVVAQFNSTDPADPYMRGLFNGLELALATLESRDPGYLAACPAKQQQPARHATQQQEATSLTELYNALADWCRESDGITVGLPSELVVALMARLAPK